MKRRPRLAVLYVCQQPPPHEAISVTRTKITLTSFIPSFTQSYIFVPYIYRCKRGLPRVPHSQPNISRTLEPEAYRSAKQIRKIKENTEIQCFKKVQNTILTFRRACFKKLSSGDAHGATFLKNTVHENVYLDWPRYIAQQMGRCEAEVDVAGSIAAVAVTLPWRRNVTMLAHYNKSLQYYLTVGGYQNLPTTGFFIIRLCFGT